LIDSGTCYIFNLQLVPIKEQKLSNNNLKIDDENPTVIWTNFHNVTSNGRVGGSGQ